MATGRFDSSGARAEVWELLSEGQLLGTNQTDLPGPRSDVLSNGGEREKKDGWAQIRKQPGYAMPELDELRAHPEIGGGPSDGQRASMQRRADMVARRETDGVVLMKGTG